MKDTKSILQPKKYKILLIGDNCTDVYQYGIIDRISPEAPVPVFEFSYEEKKPGMAGNVLENLKKLNCQVDFIFDKVSTKTRLIDIRSKQHLIRIDKDNISTPITVDLSVINSYDAIIISDYDKGTISEDTIRKITKKSLVPVFIDTKKTDLSIAGNSWVKINQNEYKKIKKSCSNLIVTLGSQGTEYKKNIYPAQNVEVLDVCGAGDTFLSALTFKFLETESIETAIKFANLAAAITVQHIGVYAPTLEEIL